MPDETALRNFDPLTFQILWSRAITIADEMSATLVRTAFSSVVRDNHDYAVAIYDAGGRMLAQSNQCTPGQLGAMPLFVADCLKQYPAETLEPGDVLITNDPWVGSGHTPDIYLATPLFRDGKLAGFAANSAHHIDIGGRMASPEAREVFEEGVIIPISKLYKRGEANDELHRLIERNVRLPDKVIGDIRAQLAANHLGVRRLEALLDEGKVDSLAELAAAVVAHTEASMREAIAAVPDGVYEHTIEMEDRDRDGNPLIIQARLDVEGDEISVDYAGTSPQVDMPINSVFNITYAYTLFPIKCALHPHIPNNEGCARPIHVSAPEGTVLNPTFPAPVMWRTALVYYLVEAVFGALAKAAPGRVKAQSGTIPLWVEKLGGRFDDGRPFILNFNAQGGQGATEASDGVSTTVFPGNVASTSVEVMENETPILCEKKELRADSGGAGKHRGGVGQEIVLRNLARKSAMASLSGGRFHIGATGMVGGGAGATGEIRIDGGEPEPIRREAMIEHDSVLHLHYPGGGGFGDPFERDPAAVLDDVRRGLVTPDRARTDYGVALTADGSAVDEDETAKLRGAA
ncbi:MAG: hydantoinase B/oxoprolinase family protein [Alphaproteobacteria bacterium]|jgi:N-methylhydantoinase B|nr:hydantoinase B/oxoprolinase family protein [Alphaproteobacteria bacterium]